MNLQGIVTVLLSLISFALANLEVSGDLYLIDDSSSRLELAKLSSTLEDAGNGIDISLDSPAASYEAGNYRVCANLGDYYNECFSYLTIEQLLAYQLKLETVGNELVRMSLEKSSGVNGIEGVIEEIQQGVVPETIKLKKRTMTYEAKKKAESRGTGTAAFEEDIVEEDQKTFVQKNWKFIVVGLLVYVFIANSSQQ